MVREAWVKGTAREILDNGVKVARDALKEVDCLDEAHKPILLQIGTATPFGLGLLSFEALLSGIADTPS